MSLVSIIMTCHNGEKYLDEALNSIFLQTYKNWELIFINNFSTDNSKDIILSKKNNKIKYFETKKILKLGEVRQVALNKCVGDYIAFLDVDDLWSKDKLERQVEKFLSNSQVDIVYTDYKLFGKIQKINLKKNNFFSGKVRDKIIKSYINGKPFTAWLTLMIKADLLKKYEKAFDENLHITSDFDMIIRISDGAYFDYIDDQLCFYRVHNTNESKNRYLEISELFYILNKYKKNVEIKGIFKSKFFYNKIYIKYFLYKIRNIFY